MTAPLPYRERVQEALMRALIETSIVDNGDGTRTAMMVSVDVVGAVLPLLAVMMEGHPDCSTPTKCRIACDQLARKLQRQIAEVRRVGSPFQRMLVEAVQ